MISANPFEFFENYRMSSWAKRGVLEGEESQSQTRTKAVPKQRRGFDLFSFVASLALLGSPVQNAAAQERPLATVPYTQATTSVQLASEDSFVAKYNVSPTDTWLSATLPSTIFSDLAVTSAAHNFVSPVERLSQESISVIGLHGLSRLRQFSLLERRWDGRDAELLKMESVDTFDQFMRVTRIAPSKTSVFMNRDGHLVLNWLDDEGRVTELDFGEGNVTFFNEASGEERVFELSAALKLKSLLVGVPESNLRTTV